MTYNKTRSHSSENGRMSNGRTKKLFNLTINTDAGALKSPLSTPIVYTGVTGNSLMGQQVTSQNGTPNRWGQYKSPGLQNMAYDSLFGLGSPLGLYKGNAFERTKTPDVDILPPFFDMDDYYANNKDFSETKQESPRTPIIGNVLPIVRPYTSKNNIGKPFSALKETMSNASIDLQFQPTHQLKSENLADLMKTNSQQQQITLNKPYQQRYQQQHSNHQNPQTHQNHQNRKLYSPQQGMEQINVLSSLSSLNTLNTMNAINSFNAMNPLNTLNTMPNSTGMNALLAVNNMETDQTQQQTAKKQAPVTHSHHHDDGPTAMRPFSPSKPRSFPEGFKFSIKPARKAVEHFLPDVPGQAFSHPYKYDLRVQLPDHLVGTHRVVYKLFVERNKAYVETNAKDKKAMKIEPSHSKHGNTPRNLFMHRVVFQVCSFHHGRSHFQLHIFVIPKTQSDATPMDQPIWKTSSFELFARKVKPDQWPSHLSTGSETASYESSSRTRHDRLERPTKRRRTRYDQLLHEAPVSDSTDETDPPTTRSRAASKRLRGSNSRNM